MQSGIVKEKKKLYGEYKKIQDIYNDSEKGLLSRAFYDQVIAYVKKLLNKYLFQKQFTDDHVNDCFLLIYEKVSSYYDEEKGCLGGFIHTVCRNYCTKINYHLTHKQAPVSLDFEYINKEDLIDRDLADGEDGEIEVDYTLDNIENYCSSLTLEDAYDQVERCCDITRQFESMSELTNKDNLVFSKVDAIKKDLLWKIWEQTE